MIFLIIREILVGKIQKPADLKEGHSIFLLFKEYNIWIRDIVKSPNFNDEGDWILWQYSNRGRVEGIDGFVDLNVFNGGLAEFQEKLLK